MKKFFIFFIGLIFYLNSVIFASTIDEWIVFFHFEDQNHTTIWKVHPDGTGLTKLTNGDYFDAWTKISFDGKYIAFVRKKGDYSDLYVMDINGKNIKRLTYLEYEGKQVHSCSWSYDNSKIVFDASIPGKKGSHEIYIINSDGTGLKQLTNNEVTDAYGTFHPITGKIIFLRENKLYSINPDGTDEKIYHTFPFSISGDQPCFTKDGKYLFVLKAPFPNQIVKINTQTWEYKQITSGGDVDRVVVSPDDKKILFDEQDFGDNTHLNLYIANIDGSNKKKLIDMYGAHASWGGGNQSCISSGYTDVDLQKKYNEGFEAGKEFCKNNPSECGMTTTDCSDEYQKGYNEGKKECFEVCKNNPSECGIDINKKDCPPCECPDNNPDNNIVTSCDNYNFTTKTLHLNCVKVGDKKYWIDMALNIDQKNNIYFTLSDFGNLFSKEDCPTLNEKECKEHSDICEWEPGIFGVGGKCKSKQ